MSVVRTWTRGAHLSQAQKMGLAAALIALGVALSFFAIPVGPARVFPFQHLINVVAGVLLGPWYALLTAFGISLFRNALGTGTILAFPGSMIGAFLVGWAYHHVRRDDVLAAVMEPVGTALIGGLVGYLIVAPVESAAVLLGILRVNPFSLPPYLAALPGAVGLVIVFGISSVPGAALGWASVRALRRAGILPESDRTEPVNDG